MTEPYRPRRDVFTQPTDELPLRQRIAITERLGSIAGVTDVTWTLRDDHRGGLTLHVGFGGWSPALHAVCINHQAPYVLTGDDHDTALEAVIEPLETSQRRRQRLGRHLGLSAPLADYADEDGDQNAETRHLLADRDLIALCGDDEDWSLLSELRQTMPGMADNVEYDGADFHDHYGTWVADTDAGPMAGTMYWIPSDGDRRYGFDGRTVRIADLDLPETAISLLAGRTVGEVAEVHPLLDGRRIVHAEAVVDGEPCLDLRVETVPAPLHPECWEPRVRDDAD